MMEEHIFGGLIYRMKKLHCFKSFIFCVLQDYTLRLISPKCTPILILLFFILYAILLYPKDKKETYEDEAPYDKTYKDDHEIKGEKSDARIPKVRMYNLCFQLNSIFIS